MTRQPRRTRNRASFSANVSNPPCPRERRVCRKLSRAAVDRASRLSVNQAPRFPTKQSSGCRKMSANPPAHGEAAEAWLRVWNLLRERRRVRALRALARSSQQMRIVCVHQGYELYGSDRAFVDLVCAIRSAWPTADIEVLLPRDGPIVEQLRAVVTRITFEPLLVLRRRQLGRLAAFGWLRLVPALWRAVAHYRTADLVYINTVVVLDYLIAARLFSTKTLVHVHEGPSGSCVRSSARCCAGPKLKSSSTRRLPRPSSRCRPRSASTSSTTATRRLHRPSRFCSTARGR